MKIEKRTIISGLILIIVSLFWYSSNREVTFIPIVGHPISIGMKKRDVLLSLQEFADNNSCTLYRTDSSLGESWYLSYSEGEFYRMYVDFKRYGIHSRLDKVIMVFYTQNPQEKLHNIEQLYERYGIEVDSSLVSTDFTIHSDHASLQCFKRSDSFSVSLLIGSADAMKRKRIESARYYNRNSDRHQVIELAKNIKKY